MGFIKNLNENTKKDHGAAGIEYLIAVIAGLFVAGFLISIFILTSLPISFSLPNHPS